MHSTRIGRRNRGLRPWTVVLIVVAFTLAVGNGGEGDAGASSELGGMRLLAAGGNGGGGSNRVFHVSGTVTDLLPGVGRPLPLTVANPHKQDISVRTLTVTVSSGNPTCPASNVQIPAWSGAVKVRGQSSGVVATLTATMKESAPNACAGTTFTLAFGGTAVSLP